jgi:hypothetical protein
VNRRSSRAAKQNAASPHILVRRDNIVLLGHR